MSSDPVPLSSVTPILMQFKIRVDYAPKRQIQNTNAIPALIFTLQKLYVFATDRFLPQMPSILLSKNFKNANNFHLE